MMPMHRLMSSGREQIRGGICDDLCLRPAAATLQAPPPPVRRPPPLGVGPLLTLWRSFLISDVLPQRLQFELSAGHAAVEISRTSEYPFCCAPLAPQMLSCHIICFHR